MEYLYFDKISVIDFSSTVINYLSSNRLWFIPTYLLVYFISSIFNLELANILFHSYITHFII